MEQNENSLPSKQVTPEVSANLLSKRFSKLKHKAMYINMEYEESSERFKIARASFVSNMFKYCHANSLNPPFTQNSQDSSENTKKEVSEVMKEFYRKIVRKTHPDKTTKLSEEEIDQRSLLYHEATEGKRSGNFNAVLKVALELDISSNNITSEDLDQIEVEISRLEDKISQMKSDIMWGWYFSSPEDQLDIFSKLTS